MLSIKKSWIHRIVDATVLTKVISVLVAVKSILTFTVQSAASKVNQHYIYSATLLGQHDVGRFDIPVTPVLMHV